MKVKLTLSMSRETVEKAKRIAAQQGKSVSKIVEEYFDSLPEPSQKRSAVQEMIELMAPHRERILKSIPKGKSYRDMVRDWRYEDYMKEAAKRTPKQRSKTK